MSRGSRAAAPVGQPPVRVPVADQQPLVVRDVQQLGDEERVARVGRRQPVQQLGRRLVERQHVGDDRPRRRVRQRREAQAVDPRARRQGLQLARLVAGPDRRDHQRRRPRQRGRQRREDRQRQLVGPLHVVEQDHERTRSRARGDQPRHRVDDPLAPRLARQPRQLRRRLGPRQPEQRRLELRQDPQVGPRAAAPSPRPRACARGRRRAGTARGTG
jgi:hypothetical protein